MEFRIDRRAGISPYLQIVNQVRHALRLGTLQPGDQLPTARAVVAQTAINPNTVLKAYRELEREGLVEARVGLGTFVLRSLARPDDDPALRSGLQQWMRRAIDSGLEREDVDALVIDVRDQEFGRPRSPQQSSVPGALEKGSTDE